MRIMRSRCTFRFLHPARLNRSHSVKSALHRSAGCSGFGTARALTRACTFVGINLSIEKGGSPRRGARFPPRRCLTPLAPIAVTVSACAQTAPAPVSLNPCPVMRSIRGTVPLPLPVWASRQNLLSLYAQNAGSAATPRPHSANPAHTTPRARRARFLQRRAIGRPPRGYPAGQVEMARTFLPAYLLPSCSSNLRGELSTFIPFQSRATRGRADQRVAGLSMR